MSVQVRPIYADGRVPHAAVKRRLVVENVADFLALEIAPREMVLGPIIPTQGLAMIHAWRGGVAMTPECASLGTRISAIRARLARASHGK